MRWYVLSLLTTVLVPMGQERTDPVKEDMAKLEGTWVVVSYTRDGVRLDDEDLKDFPKLTIKGTQYTWADGGRPGTLKIDPAKSPKAVDYTITGGGDKGTVEQAIYEINGDTWRDCIAPAGKNRPRAFDSQSGSGYILIVYRRAK